MRQIQESANAEKWPRKVTPSIECRKRDFVVRITNWLRDKDEPGFDVECYIGGVYDWNESQCFTLHEYGTGPRAKEAAVKFAAKQIAKLL